MAAQKRSSSRNFIDLVADGDDERHVAELRQAPTRPVKDYLLSLVAAMRATREEAS